jgi:hypothetical protein
MFVFITKEKLCPLWIATTVPQKRIFHPPSDYLQASPFSHLLDACTVDCYHKLYHLPLDHWEKCCCFLLWSLIAMACVYLPPTTTIKKGNKIAHINANIRKVGNR